MKIYCYYDLTRDIVKFGLEDRTTRCICDDAAYNFDKFIRSRKRNDNMDIDLLYRLETIADFKDFTTGAALEEFDLDTFP